MRALSCCVTCVGVVHSSLSGWKNRTNESNFCFNARADSCVPRATISVRNASTSASAAPALLSSAAIRDSRSAHRREATTAASLWRLLDRCASRNCRSATSIVCFSFRFPNHKCMASRLPSAGGFNGWEGRAKCKAHRILPGSVSCVFTCDGLARHSVRQPPHTHASRPNHLGATEIGPPPRRRRRDRRLRKPRAHALQRQSLQRRRRRRAHHDRRA
mmetsp:Transcript_1386/g.2895  ORF Transcript_1386/g.2895 Transcript_1386/m.2895 type:complete len:217 (-) Transcript_1386:113-763(-)